MLREGKLLRKIINLQGCTQKNVNYGGSLRDRRIAKRRRKIPIKPSTGPPLC